MTPPRQASWGAAPIRRQSFLERRLGLTWAPIGRDFRICRACTCCTCSPAAPAARCRRLSHKLMPGIRSPQHSTCAKLRVVRTVGAHRTSAQDGMSPGNNKQSSCSILHTLCFARKRVRVRQATHTHRDHQKERTRSLWIGVHRRLTKKHRDDGGLPLEDCRFGGLRSSCKFFDLGYTKAGIRWLPAAWLRSLSSDGSSPRGTDNSLSSSAAHSLSHMHRPRARLLLHRHYRHLHRVGVRDQRTQQES